MEGFLKLSTAVNVTVVMISSTDHISGKTGLTLTIYASKAAGSFASISPTVTELDSTNAPGVYKLAFTTSHTDTLGELQLHITGTGADPADYKWQVATYLPGEAATLQADQAVNVTKFNGTSVTARDIGASVLLSNGTGTGQVSLSSGAVTVGTNNDKTGYGLSAAAVQAIWDALTSALTTANSIGKLLVDNIDATISSRLASASYTAPPSAASIASAVWDSLTSALTTIGSIGKLLVTDIDATISSRLASASYTAPDNTSITAIKAKTDNLPSDPADASDIAAAFAVTDGLITTVDTVVDAIKLKTDNLPASPANETTVSAVKAKTDSLTFTVANQVDANMQSINDTQLTGDGAGTPWGPV